MKETVIRKSIVDCIYRYLKSQGVDTDDIMCQYPLIPVEADGLEASLPMSQFFQLFEQAAEITKDPDIGLRIYHGVDWTDLGLFAYAHMNASTVEAALNVNVRYQCMMQNHMHFSLTHDDEGGLIYSYLIRDDALPVSRQDNDLSIAGAVYSIRDLTGNLDWSPREVHFTHAQPADVAAYKKLLGCPIKFDMPACRLFVDAEMAASPIVGGDSKLFAILEVELKRLNEMAGTENLLLKEVQQAVADALSQGVPSIETIAARLHLGRRSLQRRLSDTGHTFKGVVEDTRKQLARRYLKSSNYPLVEVAFLLGYSELSAFIRAFRRWTGQTPQQYRLKHAS